MSLRIRAMPTIHACYVFEDPTKVLPDEVSVLDESAKLRIVANGSVLLDFDWTQVESFSSTKPADPTDMEVFSFVIHETGMGSFQFAFEVESEDCESLSALYGQHAKQAGGETLWHRHARGTAAAIPDGYKIFKNADNRTYYLCEATQVTSWTLPTSWTTSSSDPMTPIAQGTVFEDPTGMLPEENVGILDDIAKLKIFASEKVVLDFAWAQVESFSATRPADPTDLDTFSFVIHEEGMGSFQFVLEVESEDCDRFEALYTRWVVSRLPGVQLRKALGRGSRPRQVYPVTRN
jgi:hypothetical protein